MVENISLPESGMREVITIIMNFITGSLLIITGVSTMGGTLERANSKLLNKTISLFSKNRWTAFFTGIFLTGLVQSSTAVTILTVSLVDSGIMKLEAAVSIVYGANIGTTFNAQFMSLHISQYAWYILIAGCILSFGTVARLKTAGTVIAGAGLMFSGLDLMSKSVMILKDNSFLAQWMQDHSENIFLCLVTGLVFTMLAQSSSATVGMTILLFNNGLLPFASAVALTLGDNIGSCIIAQIASIKSGTAGKRVALAHTLYNVLGVAVAFLLLPQFCGAVLVATRHLGQDSSHLVANTHTIFNLLSAMLFLPISKYYVQLLRFILPDKIIER
ncbi:Na/Pi cotransporter family protein [Anaerocolumna jejuensis]|nr:Na/Pi symporter [Anaerocolumna jejuensis]